MGQLELNLEVPDEKQHHPDVQQECAMSLHDLLLNAVSPRPVEVYFDRAKDKPVFALQTAPGVSRLIGDITPEAFLRRLYASFEVLAAPENPTPLILGHSSNMFTMPCSRLKRFFYECMIQSSWIFDQDTRIYVYVDVKFAQDRGKPILRTLSISFYDEPHTISLH